ncbi:MAG: hypothetical protein O3A84_13965 [Proteobacteria bacterium]|nr:hypothetical protein [Pseudomonadota bacterium]
MSESDFSQRLDRAFKLVQDGELRSAIPLCVALRQESPTHPLGAFLEGAVALKSDRLDDAVECFQEAIAHDPGIAEFHKTLGDALVRMTELEAATDAYLKAKQLSPERSDIRYALARCQQQRGLFNEALTNYDIIADTASEFSGAQLQAAKILHDLAQHAQDICPNDVWVLSTNRGGRLYCGRCRRLCQDCPTSRDRPRRTYRRQ